MEIWKDIYFEENGVIYDYREIYQVSNLGRVKSLNYKGTGQERILKVWHNPPIRQLCFGSLFCPASSCIAEWLAHRFSLPNIIYALR